jgi:hypothetical protein
VADARPWPSSDPPRAPRLCVSIPVHEQPAVILDEVENLRAFLGAETQIVLHLSASMELDPAEVQPLLPEGVYANPVSHRTAWGDIGYLHIENLRFAYAHLDPFDHVLLQASNDLYIRPGAPAVIAAHQAGYHARPVTAETAWAQAGPAHRDPRLAAMLADLGGGHGVVGAQVEGSYYAADLFAEVLERIGRHYQGPSPGDEAYAREEVYFSTVATPLLTGPRGEHLVYADGLTTGPDVSPAVIFAIFEGVLAGEWTEEDLYAVKRVPRELHHPHRDLIRGLTRAQRPRRLAVPRTFEAKAFLTVALATDLVRDPSLVAAWHATFTDQDDASLVVALDPADEWLLPELVDALHAGGTGGPGAADVVLDTVAPGTFAEASLRANAHVVLRPAGEVAPPVLDDALLIRPEQAGELRYLYEARVRRGR